VHLLLDISYIKRLYIYFTWKLHKFSLRSILSWNRCKVIRSSVAVQNLIAVTYDVCWDWKYVCTITAAICVESQLQLAMFRFSHRRKITGKIKVTAVITKLSESMDIKFARWQHPAVGLLCVAGLLAVVIGNQAGKRSWMLIPTKTSMLAFSCCQQSTYVYSLVDVYSV